MERFSREKFNSNIYQNAFFMTINACVPKKRTMIFVLQNKNYFIIRYSFKYITLPLKKNSAFHYFVYM